MKIVIPGGSGQIGTFLARRLHADGHEVVVLSRKPMAAAWRVVEWDAQTLGSWADELNGAEAVINMAGRSVNCRYNAANRREIIASRIFSTRIVGEAIARATRPPRVWLQSSTATIYAHRYDEPNDEATGLLGGNEPNLPDTWQFSITVACAWEHELDAAVTPHTRKIALRSAMVMSPDKDGVFDTLLRLTRFGLGGKSGNGQQYVSWIHEEDFIRVLYWLIEREEATGAINLAAPNPLPNAEFMRELRQAWGIGIGLPAASWMLEIGAFFLRTETELILKSRRVVPAFLEQRGFEFQFPDWHTAALDLCRRWRANKCS